MSKLHGHRITKKFTKEISLQKKMRRQNDPMLGIYQIKKTTNLEVIRELGHGMFSYVYQARNPTGEIVAVKYFTEAPKNEIQIIQLCQDCKYVIKVYEFKQLEGYSGILIQESFDSIPEREIKKVLNLELLKKLTRMLVEALVGIHSHHVIHSDFKLDNILIAPNFDDIRVIDFGCAHKITDKRMANNGARAYRPPEQLLGYNKYDEKADIWALGITLYLLTVSHNDPWSASRALVQGLNMAKTFGKENMVKLINDYKIPLNAKDISSMSEEITLPLDKIFENISPQFNDQNLISFMKSIFVLDPKDRPSAEDLLKHPFIANP